MVECYKVAYGEDIVAVVHGSRVHLQEKLKYIWDISAEIGLDDLIKYRSASAKEKLVSAKLLLEAGLYKDSIGRSYYAIFS